eukprot:403344573
MDLTPSQIMQKATSFQLCSETYKKTMIKTKYLQQLIKQFNLQIYGGTLKTKFQPEKVTQDQEGILFHPLEGHKYLKYGAFDLSLAMKIGETLEIKDNLQEYFTWNHSQYHIKRVESQDIL